MCHYLQHLTSPLVSAADAVPAAEAADDAAATDADSNDKWSLDM